MEREGRRGRERGVEACGKRLRASSSCTPPRAPLQSTHCSTYITTFSFLFLEGGDGGEKGRRGSNTSGHSRGPIGQVL